MTAARPIGVFDSGVGGLSVVRAIRAMLPHEDLLYVADSAHVPYGHRPAAFVEARSVAIADFLLAQGAKAIVVACNTATSAAIVALRARFAVPIIGMEPAVKPAVQHTRAGAVGVLATTGTLAGEKFARLRDRFGAAAAIHVQPCPGLVERVEAGDVAGDATRALVEAYVAPLLQRGVDTIVLGCTHYPFLKPLIEIVAGPGVAIVDPSPAVARELKRRLTEAGLLAAPAQAGALRLWTSGAPATVQRVVAGLWGNTVGVQLLPGIAAPLSELSGPADSRDQTLP